GRPRAPRPSASVCGTPSACSWTAGAGTCRPRPPGRRSAGWSRRRPAAPERRRSARRRAARTRSRAASREALPYRTRPGDANLAWLDAPVIVWRTTMKNADKWFTLAHVIVLGGSLLVVCGAAAGCKHAPVRDARGAYMPPDPDDVPKPQAGHNLLFNGSFD